MGLRNGKKHADNVMHTIILPNKMFTIAIHNADGAYYFYSLDLDSVISPHVKSETLQDGLSEIRRKLIETNITTPHSYEEVRESYGDGCIYHFIEATLIKITGSLKKGTFTKYIDPTIITKIDTIKSAYQPTDGESYSIMIETQDINTKTGELKVNSSVFHGCPSKESADELTDKIWDTQRGVSIQDEFITFDKPKEKLFATGTIRDRHEADTASEKEDEMFGHYNEPPPIEAQQNFFEEFEEELKEKKFKKGDKVVVARNGHVVCGDFIQYWDGECEIGTENGRISESPENVSLYND